MAALGVKTGALAAQEPLFDSFRRLHTYLRIAITERCNLRCIYCMPPEGVCLSRSSDLLREDEMLRLVALFARLGVTKVRLTGGEPLVYPRIIELCRAISSTQGIKTVALTTNGTLLMKKLPALKEAGVTALNISLDTLRPERFAAIARRPGFQSVVDGVNLAETLGFKPLKLNCVLMRGVNDDEIGSFVDFTKSHDVDVRFIEYMPFEGNQWSHQRIMPFADALAVAERHVGKPLVALGDPDTAKMFQVRGYRGRVGFISSMTDHFCASCNRLRLTADGNLKLCLFGQKEWSLRDTMRSGATDSELEVFIRAALLQKHFSHDGEGSPADLASATRRPMSKIGG